MEVAEGVSLCRRCLFPADHLTFFCVRESGSVVSEGPAVAGREFFPFGCFEHRMASGAGNISMEGAADAGGDSGSGKSPALKPEPRKWSKPPAKHFDPNGRM